MQICDFLKKRVIEDRIEIIESTSNRGLLAKYAKSKCRPPICTRVSTTMKSAYLNAKLPVSLNYQIEAKFEYKQIIRSDSLVTHSKSHAIELENELGISNQGFKIIPHGIPTYSNHIPVSENKNINILFVGRLERRKGIDVLLKAIPLVFKSNEYISFHIIGADPLKLGSFFSSNLNIKEKVNFLGKVPNDQLKKAYQKCDIFVAPSYYESFGLIFAEAMAYGKPVIGTNVGGIPDVVEHNTNGILVTPGDQNELAEAILKLANSSKLRVSMGNAGRKRVKEKFSIPEMASNSVKLYEEVLSKKKKILTLSDMQKKGGASIACNRIANALRAQGNLVFSISSDGSISDCHFPLFLGKKFHLLSSFFSTSLTKQLIAHFRGKELNRQLYSILGLIKPDFINVHNLHSAGWPISLVKTCLNVAPVVWTLHDCWSFLGSFYPTHSAQPSKTLKREIDFFWRSLKQKPSINQLSAVTPSKWMKKQAGKQYWEDYQVEAIPNPIPRIFNQTKDRLACKRALNLDETKTNILCIAGDLNEERKGGNFIKNIVGAEWSNKVEFFFLGNGSSSFRHNKNVKSLGFIRDDITIQLAYHAADLVLHPAPVDNLPNTVAESLSCGTPVMAFNTGGLPEMVVPDRSGWLVQSINSKNMLNKLKLVLESRGYSFLRDSTRRIAQDLFDEKHVEKQYEKHFMSLKNPANNYK